MLSTVTRQAPSLSLQTFQEISEETLLLQAEGFQRSPLALASPDPPPASGQRGKGRGLAAGRATWTRRGSGEGSTQEDANQEQRAEMLAPSRWAPPAASQVWEISASSEAPEGTSPVATSATPVPKRQLCWELGKGASSAFPVAQLSPKQLPSRSSMPRDAGRPGRSCTPAGGAARGGDSPPRAALGAGV